MNASLFRRCLCVLTVVKDVINIDVCLNFFFSVPLSQLRIMLENVVRTLKFMYSSLDRWVISKVFSFQSLVFNRCSLKKRFFKCLYGFSLHVLSPLHKTRILFLTFCFSLNTSKTLFKKSLLFQKIWSLIRLNHSHNQCHSRCQQHSANVLKHCL